MTRGSIAKSRATPSVTGMSIATTAELLISSVSTIDSAEMMATATGPLLDQREIVFCDSHCAAPELLVAAPSAMAPPYMSRMPQLT